MSKAGAMLRRSAAFKILNIYSTLWMRAKARVEVKGFEKVPPRNRGERRVYLLMNHSTTYDVVALMHVSKSPFVVMMDSGAFNFPVIRHVLAWAGFVPLDKKDSAPAVESCMAAVREGRPLLISLHDGDSTIGDWGRPRTGGIRIAHRTGAMIYPVFLKVEEDRIRRLRFKGVNGTEYPYTTFKDTLYFVEFLPPVELSSLPEDSGYAEYRKVADELDALSDSVEASYEAFLSENRQRFASLRRRGGTRFRISW
jgi:1-acyl-sn-glycerol-3-phosphate acyltransferase